ncbi:MAG: hypothetical protein H0U41_04715 [Actinobacteria bacterium]|nr:hypothetical protein [Actinomycetota bacterium]
MPQRALRRVSPRLCAGAFAALLVIGAAGCGGDKLDTTEAVESFNTQFKAFEVKLDCPDTIDKDVTEVDCTIQGNKTGKTAPVTLAVSGDKEKTVTPKDDAAVQRAVEEVIK